MKNIHIFNPLQSAHRKHHFTEVVPLKLKNNIIISIDKGEVEALTLFELLAAFDTIDHVTLQIDSQIGMEYPVRLTILTHLLIKKGVLLQLMFSGVGVSVNIYLWVG